jgi:hypothetical protein
MHLSDLLHSRAYDADGVDIGRVGDVRLVQDGPVLLPFGAAFRVEGLVVGNHSLETRLGFQRGALTGPWLVRVLCAGLERRARYVDWNDVVSWDGRVVRIAKRRAELGPVDD